MTAKSKEFRFPVQAEWRRDRTVVVQVPGKPELEIAPPPEFWPQADPTVWSPEDAFGAAAASCLAVTILGRAERERLPLLGLLVEAHGVAGRRPDGRFGFVRLEQRVEIATEPGEENRARELVEASERGCLVTVSLDLPVETTIDVQVAAVRY
ncbi:MAG TPA: OsmC family protein [Gaiellaceae bacterium]|nr:OsmC family protein [Gaiellaceae bacterium]